jgi:hypothetical protein
MKDLEIGQDILNGQPLSEIPPNPPFKKRGAGGISGRAVAKGNTPPADRASVNRQIELKSNSSRTFRKRSHFQKGEGLD